MILGSITQISVHLQIIFMIFVWKTNLKTSLTDDYATINYY